MVPFMHSEGLPSKRAIHRFFNSMGDSGAAVVMLALADTLATYGDTLNRSKWQHEVAVSKALLSSWWEEQDSVVTPQPLLDGNDLQDLFNLTPGKQIGMLLAALIEAQACGEVKSKQEAKTFVQDYLDQT
jgi:poly(A) polymerase